MPKGHSLGREFHKDNPDKALTYKQQRFVEEYLQDPKRRQIQAAVRAGYSIKTARQASCWLMKSPYILKQIEKGESQLADAIGIDQHRIMQELAKIGFANMADYAPLLEDGASLRDLPRDVTAAIKDIQVQSADSEKGSVRQAKISLADKRAALIDMGKQIGMFREKIEVTGKFDLESFVKDIEKLENNSKDDLLIDVTPVEHLTEPTL